MISQHAWLALRKIGQPWLRSAARLPLLALLASAAGCSGVQSALDPAGREPSEVGWLFAAMLVAAALIWSLVVGLAAYAISRPHGNERIGRAIIMGGGIAFPVIVLTGLLIPGLAMIPGVRQPADGRLHVAVVGEQWWWRVAYRGEGIASPIVGANEVRLPLGQRVELTLDGPGVIHSFWVPPLAGKVEMIPGRTNRLVLEPTRVGTYRGVCAEFCGTSHALMAFSVVVMEPDAFAAGLQAEAAPVIAIGPVGDHRCSPV